MATFAKAPPGSGANFAKLKGALAARGASDPGALAAYIGRKKYGHKGMAKLSAMGQHKQEHSNALIDTPTRATPPANRLPVVSPWDILVSRNEDGSAQVRHRRGGTDIGTIKRGEDGSWAAKVANGAELPGHAHQRSALMELLGTWNTGASKPERAAAVPYAEPPKQTPLMEKFGVPAISALATPMTSASDGPRVTAAGSSDTSGSEDTNGLSPKGKAIYAKLKARGFPAERALAFAKRAQNMGAGGFKKASS
jgi:hypothetical protein